MTPQTPAVGQPLDAESVRLLVKGDLLMPVEIGTVFDRGVPVVFLRSSVDSHSVRVRAPHCGPHNWFAASRFTFLGRPDADGWIKHEGGENPAPGLMVDVNWRSGVVITALSDDEASIDWSHPFGVAHDDVVAWRPHAPAPQVAHPEPASQGRGARYGDETAEQIVRRWAGWINDVSADMDEPEWGGKTHNDVLNERDFLLRALASPAQDEPLGVDLLLEAGNKLFRAFHTPMVRRALGGHDETQMEAILSWREATAEIERRGRK